MEQLISDIEAYCQRTGIAPQKLLRDAINAQWGQWQKWKTGESSPTMKVADRVRGYMSKDDVAHDLPCGEISPTHQPDQNVKRSRVVQR
ncbi:hypothetical protein PE067_16085 [Paracoccus sp. DMF-8]|uniref:hypothetical protein n=1 Tax=Paracoccus sp. DMF-8 TaxID=3019445 RepID=UPI0023E35E17|nr:hypothetical protein [Paracoccus sp. DMF-8]MDF3607527.1 hypothetical protein [Paracoccus sp. DMF-8]